MTWFFLISLCTNCAGDAGINPGFRESRAGVELQMPSQEACEQIKQLNQRGECWATNLTRKMINTNQ